MTLIETKKGFPKDSLQEDKLRRFHGKFGHVNNLYQSGIVGPIKIYQSGRNMLKKIFTIKLNKVKACYPCLNCYKITKPMIMHISRLMIKVSSSLQDLTIFKSLSHLGNKRFTTLMKYKFI